MCVFLVFGGLQTHEATIIIGVWVAECAYFSCLEAIARTKPLVYFYLLYLLQT